MQVYTHTLHGLSAATPTGGDSPSQHGPDAKALAKTQLVATDGKRLVAVGSGGAVDFYDANNVHELNSVFGAGACKFKLLGSHAVTDLGSEVALHSVTFLHGGLLAVVGDSGRAAVIHVYRLNLSGTVVPKGASPGAPAYTFRSEAGAEAAPEVRLSILPQLVYRAALPQELAGSIRLLRHPAALHTFGVVLPGDASVRFYRAAPSPGLATADAGVITHHAPVYDAVISRDGAYLALVSSGGLGAAAELAPREVALYALGTAPDTPSAPASPAVEEAAACPRYQLHHHRLHRLAVASEGGLAASAEAPVASETTASSLIGVHVRSFLAEFSVTALAFLPIPVAPDAGLFSRFEHGGVVLATGHDNGFLNLWWAGNTQEPHQPTRGSAVRPAGKGGAYPVTTEPDASYPPLHASRDAITHITPGVVVTEDDAPGPALGALAAAARGKAVAVSAPLAVAPKTSTVFAVGAAGARGWRVYTLDHAVPLCYTPEVAAAARAAVRLAFSSPSTALSVATGTPGARAAGPAAVTTPAARKAARLASEGAGAAASPSSPSSRAGGSGAASPAEPRCASAKGSGVRPNYVPGHWQWDAVSGHRSYHPPAPLATAHLETPWVRWPSYADVVRAPVVGETTWQSQVGAALAAGGLPAAPPLPDGGLATATAPALAGLLPLGAALLTLTPCSDADFVHDYARAAPDGTLLPGEASAAAASGADLVSAVLAAARSGAGGSAAGAGASKAGQCPFVCGPNVWRLLARGVVTGLVHPGGAAVSPWSSTEPWPLEGAGATPPADKPRFLQLPRVVFLLVSETGLHAAGLDYHTAVVTDAMPAATAAAAVSKLAFGGDGFAAGVARSVAALTAERVPGSLPPAAAPLNGASAAGLAPTGAPARDAVAYLAGVAGAEALPPLQSVPAGAVDPTAPIPQPCVSPSSKPAYWPSRLPAQTASAAASTCGQTQVVPAPTGAAAAASGAHSKQAREARRPRLASAPRLRSTVLDVTEVSAAGLPLTADRQPLASVSSGAAPSVQLQYLPRHSRERALRRAAGGASGGAISPPSVPSASMGTTASSGLSASLTGFAPLAAGSTSLADTYRRFDAAEAAGAPAPAEAAEAAPARAASPAAPAFTVLPFSAMSGMPTPVLRGQTGSFLDEEDEDDEDDAVICAHEPQCGAGAVKELGLDETGVLVLTDLPPESPAPPAFTNAAALASDLASMKAELEALRVLVATGRHPAEANMRGTGV